MKKYGDDNTLAKYMLFGAGVVSLIAGVVLCNLASRQPCDCKPKPKAEPGATEATQDATDCEKVIVGRDVLAYSITGTLFGSIGIIMVCIAFVWRVIC